MVLIKYKTTATITVTIDYICRFQSFNPGLLVGLISDDVISVSVVELRSQRARRSWLHRKIPTSVAVKRAQPVPVTSESDLSRTQCRK